MDIGLTTLPDEDINKYLSDAYRLLERFSISVEDDEKAKTDLAGTRRRFVSTVATGGLKRATNVALVERLASVAPDDPLLSPGRHGLLHGLRRGLAVGMAVAEAFSRQTELENLKDENRAAPLQGDPANRFRKLLETEAFVALFTAARFVAATLPTGNEPASDGPEPMLEFNTVRDAQKGFLYTVDRVLADQIDSASTAPADDQTLIGAVRAAAEATLEALLARQQRFSEIAVFDRMHIRLDQDDFTLDGLDTADRRSRRPLVMTFKKPHEVVGNHIAKYQALKVAKMLMAYDFDRQMNPFVDLGGFLFAFIGDGFPGTGKTTLIQMIAGLMDEYCKVAGYTFHYENFGVDQISSYQGKSGQNCRQFIDNVMDPRVIGFGTIDDLDQVAANRSDDNTSAGQQEITAVLMEAFAGAGTVVRGNCSFGMFSNYPEKVDDALRQRAGARWPVDGPQTEADYVDIFALLIGKNHSIPVGDHDLYADQEIKRAVKQAYEKLNVPAEAGLKAIYEREIGRTGTPTSLAEIGRYLHAIKEVEPRFTGRAIKNITDAVKMRAMDIELPDEWFETPEPFLRKSYDDKRAMIADLRGPITVDMIVQEIHRYADSEFRYTDKSDETSVNAMIRNERLRERAAREIVSLKDSGKWNA
ncbi:MAG: ATP-binding protein [Pseudomonadota bacterium]